MLNKAARIFEQGFVAIAEDAVRGKSRIRAIFEKIARYPFKILAAYIAAPILLFKIAHTVKNPTRRTHCCPNKAIERPCNMLFW